jgi:hypothetical protein
LFAKNNLIYYPNNNNNKMMKKRAPRIKQTGDWLNHLNIGYALEQDEDNPRQPAFSFVGATIPL